MPDLARLHTAPALPTTSLQLHPTLPGRILTTLRVLTGIIGRRPRSCQWPAPVLMICIVPLAGAAFHLFALALGIL